MSRSDWLAIAGIALTLIFGIPSIRYFTQGNRALGGLSLFLTFVILALTVYFYWLSRLPPYTVISSHLKVEILNPAGNTARIRKTVVLRPNHHGLEHYAHRNISYDGTATFRVNPEVTLVEHHVAAGDHFIYVRFPHQLRRFSHVSTWLEADQTDTFTSSP